jgi:sec-independent protein translocase protein TatA
MEILIVLIVALVIFGPKRIPELGRSVGSGIREFRGTISGEQPALTESDAKSARKADEPA